MLTLAAIIALVSVPYVLDVYFTPLQDSGPTNEKRATIETAEE